MKEQMTAFLIDLVNEYRHARKPFRKHEKLSRGESRSISALSEDLFAYYLAKHYPRINNIFINQTFTSIYDGARRRIKPDVSVCVNNEIRAMFDLKMDLGYARESIVEHMQIKNEMIINLQNREVTFWTKLGEGREKRSITVSNSAFYAYIVVSDKNIDDQQLKSARIASTKLPNIKFFTLLNKTHPNEYNLSVSEMKNKVTNNIDNSEILRLDNIIRESIR